MGSWRSGGSGSRGSFGKPGYRTLPARSGSDGPSWRKDTLALEDRRADKKKGDEEEVTSLAKKIKPAVDVEKELIGKDNT